MGLHLINIAWLLPDEALMLKQDKKDLGDISPNYDDMIKDVSRRNSKYIYKQTIN